MKDYVCLLSLRNWYGIATATQEVVQYFAGPAITSTMQGRRTRSGLTSHGRTGFATQIFYIDRAAQRCSYVA